MIAARDLRVGDELRDEAGRLISTIAEVENVNPQVVSFLVRKSSGGLVARLERPGRLLPFTRPERTNA